MKKLEDAIQKGLAAGAEISAEFTPKVWKKIIEEKEHPPTLKKQLEIIESPIYPFKVHLD